MVTLVQLISPVKRRDRRENAHGKNGLSMNFHSENALSPLCVAGVQQQELAARSRERGLRGRHARSLVA
jgi:hypothetical protein